MCVGKLAASCTKEHWKHDLEMFTQFGLQCLKSDNKFEIKESAISYFSDLSVLAKNEIPMPIFEDVMAELFKVCMKDDDALKKKQEEKPQKPGDFSLDTDSDDMDNFEDDIEIDNSIVDEKSAAVNAIGVFGCHSPGLAKSCLKEMISALQFL